MLSSRLSSSLPDKQPESLCENSSFVQIFQLCASCFCWGVASFVFSQGGSRESVANESTMQRVVKKGGGTLWSHTYLPPPRPRETTGVCEAFLSRPSLPHNFPLSLPPESSPHSCVRSKDGLRSAREPVPKPAGQGHRQGKLLSWVRNGKDIVSHVKLSSGALTP